MLLIDGQPWFVAREFGLLMGRRNPEGILHLLEDDQRALVTLRHGESCETTEVISESATYAAYYRYRNPENRNLRRWLSQDVIPTLRDQAITAALETAPGTDDLGRQARQPARMAGRALGTAGKNAALRRWWGEPHL